jgi:hypothetical protein
MDQNILLFCTNLVQLGIGKRKRKRIRITAVWKYKCITARNAQATRAKRDALGRLAEQKQERNVGAEPMT